jgi:hypothetical protein
MPGSGIFISYRRDDSAGFAGRLYDRLAERFGADRVFMDIDAIAPGHEFAIDIERALAECTACVVLIGRDWLTIKDPDGGRRLDDSTDFVRLEVATAIRRGIAVFPVLVDKASPPSSAALPDEIRQLAGRQAIELTNERWNYDVGRLLLSLEEEVGPKEPTPRRPERAPRKRSLKLPALIVVGALLLLVVAAGWLATRPSGGSTGSTTTLPLNGTYDVRMHLVRFTGTLGEKNNLWDEPNPEEGVSGDSWDSQHWIFSPIGGWTVVERDVIDGILSDGGYTDVGTAHCGPNGTQVVRHFVPTSTSPAGSPAETFSGAMTIHWDCDISGPVDAMFGIEGTRSG